MKHVALAFAALFVVAATNPDASHTSRRFAGPPTPRAAHPTTYTGTLIFVHVAPLLEI